jgi:phosphate transport system permease protein
VPEYDPNDPLAPNTVFTSSTFIAGIVVGLMITPIMTSIMREVFSQAPVGEREAALGLGATKWGMIRSVLIPFGVVGIIGGTMLGLGRALGETIAVYMIISPIFAIQPFILQNGASSISSLIALKYGEASAFGMSALMAAGLMLKLITEQPWAHTLQPLPEAGFSLAPGAHVAGVAAGLLVMCIGSALRRVHASRLARIQSLTH